jgi:DNA-binding transcriptional LysR family regulator
MVQTVSIMETISMTDLRSFVEIARSLGITRAGEALGVPKAAVSKSLARLEHQLGVRLFERSTRRLAITPAGVVLQRRAEGLLADVESLLGSSGGFPPLGEATVTAAPASRKV